ncbi:MAG: hypothetical protein KAI66_13315, partial [Lentisphaeria bacterium]|nr:hypothetical protein [Lentisphaeria bacterium]
MKNIVRLRLDASLLLTTILLIAGTGCSSLRRAGLPGQESIGRSRQTYVFFANGRPRCRILLPAQPEIEEKEAAELIQRVFQEMGGGKT